MYEKIEMGHHIFCTFFSPSGLLYILCTVLIITICLFSTIDSMINVGQVSERMNDNGLYLLKYISNKNQSIHIIALKIFFSLT